MATQMSWQKGHTKVRTKLNTIKRVDKWATSNPIVFWALIKDVALSILYTIAAVATGFLLSRWSWSPVVPGILLVFWCFRRLWK